jgi:outer membrane protein assembly factor BamB
MRGFLLLAFCASLPATDWPTFRGVNSSGIAPDRGLIEDFGPEKNVIWKTPLPPGHSSPVIVGSRIYLTGFEEKKLYTFALERSTGKILWRREAPRPREETLHKANSPTSASAATDGKNVFVFFADFGILSYGPDGEERWRLPLGPFNNPMGQSSTPVLTGNTILLPLDQEAGSYFIAVDARNGTTKWKVDRSDFTRGFSTPILWTAPNGRKQVLLAGSYRLVAYDVETGKEEWYVGGLTWQLKPTPVIDGENIFILGWAGEADPGQQEVIPDFAEVIAKIDANKDGKIQKDELDAKTQKKFADLDLDNTGALEKRDWSLYQAKRSVINGVNAFKLGGKGDMTVANRLWKYEKALPNVPSPVLYQGVLYMVKDGGIFTALDSKTGAQLKQGRVTGALGSYFASPIAADGKIYTMNEEGKLAVIRAGADWEVIKVIDFNDGVHATPAIVDGRIYVRTHSALYCFGKQ